jgi:hypothetical protein
MSVRVGMMSAWLRMLRSASSRASAANAPPGSRVARLISPFCHCQHACQTTAHTERKELLTVQTSASRSYPSQVSLLHVRSRKSASEVAPVSSQRRCSNQSCEYAQAQYALRRPASAARVL